MDLIPSCADQISAGTPSPLLFLCLQNSKILKTVRHQDTVCLIQFLHVLFKASPFSTQAVSLARRLSYCGDAPHHLLIYCLAESEYCIPQAKECTLLGRPFTQFTQKGSLSSRMVFSPFSHDPSGVHCRTLSSVYNMLPYVH